MSIPQLQVTPNGYLAPTRTEYQDGLWQMLRDAFGQDLNRDERTPQGQLVTSLTAILMDKDTAFIELANNFDPRYATGEFQEALGAIYFLKRDEATFSVCQLEFTGAEYTIVPAGFTVQDENGNRWETTEAGEIGANGKVLVWVKALDTGSIFAATGAINQLVDGLAGVDSVTNLTPAAAGRETESRTDFEIRRRESVAANARLTVDSVHGAIAGLEGVIDVAAVDNPSDAPITVGETAYPMIRNSILVSVVGGDDYEIAGEIVKKAGTGCSFVGNTDVLWRDVESYNDQFPPQYDVKFLRPDILPLWFSVRVADINAVAPEQILRIKQSILDQLAAGVNRARIGGRIIPMAFNAGIEKEVNAIEIKASLDGVNWHSSIQFGIDQFPACSQVQVEVVQYVA